MGVGDPVDRPALAVNKLCKDHVGARNPRMGALARRNTRCATSVAGLCFTFPIAQRNLYPEPDKIPWRVLKRTCLPDLRHR